MLTLSARAAAANLNKAKRRDVSSRPAALSEWLTERRATD